MEFYKFIKKSITNFIYLKPVLNLISGFFFLKKILNLPFYSKYPKKN